MTVPTTIDAAGWLSKYLEGPDADGDMARAMLKTFVDTLMSAEARYVLAFGHGLTDPFTLAVWLIAGLTNGSFHRRVPKVAPRPPLIAPAWGALSSVLRSSALTTASATRHLVRAAVR